MVTSIQRAIARGSRKSARPVPPVSPALSPHESVDRGERSAISSSAQSRHEDVETLIEAAPEEPVLSLLEHLERLNRKERFFLVALALGNPKFRLSARFRRELSSKIGVEVPDQARCWMDYHLDWVYAALQLTAKPGEARYDSPRFPRERSEDGVFNVNENQEDTDLLVAFELREATHLVFIEAKATTLFTNGQLGSKARRLGRIFGQDDTDAKYQENPRVVPHFVLASPGEPTMRSDPFPHGLKAEGIPAWMLDEGKFRWLRLRIPDRQWEIERCGEDAGRGQTDGSYWHLKAAVEG